ncbi:MAG: nucleoside deaminase [Proteobacteria bacterium]|jgi:tRNA(Arg) A34 adenosine deaminase TadA|nr:nucleoside deaminase [Pseudomonadota bacterium]
MMVEAFRLAREAMADGRGGPFGAVVVRGGTIVGRGANRVVREADPTAHAEVVAIREACRALGTHDLSGTTIYATCEPCPMCLAAIYWAHIDRIFFAGSHEDASDAGFDDSLIYRELRAPRDARKVPMIEYDRAEAKRLFDEWRANPDRVSY